MKNLKTLSCNVCLTGAFTKKQLIVGKASEFLFCAVTGLPPLHMVTGGDQVLVAVKGLGTGYKNTSLIPRLSLPPPPPPLSGESLGTRLQGSPPPPHP